MRPRTSIRHRGREGLTLLEILLVLAVLGIMIGLGITVLGRLGRNQAYQGYVAGFSQAVSDATTRANETNTIYALEFDGNGYTWGPVGGTLASCTGAASAPSLTSTVKDQPAPRNVSAGDTGWFCFSAPGLIYRLDKLSSTCTYKTYTFPCMTFTGPGRQEKMFISVGGQVIVE